MVIKKFASLLITGLLLGVLGTALAVDLHTVYQDAIAFDPVFHKAMADWRVAQQASPLARAGNGSPGTGLFPNIDLQGNYVHTMARQSSAGMAQSGQYDTYGYQVNVTQPLFNFATWMSIQAADYSVRAATALYLAAAQQLMLRVATAYFEVLRAHDALLLTRAQQNQFQHQLATAQQKFKVGLIAVTGVYDAKASFDRAMADAIRDRNQLQDRIEDLRAITGKTYPVLLGLKDTVPLIMPQPVQVDGWVKAALAHNYLLQADLNSMLSARQAIKAAASVKLPIVNAVASYQDGSSQALSLSPPGVTPSVRLQEGTVGAQLDIPLFRGSYDIQNTKQARYQYLSAVDQLHIDQRAVEKNTRQAYLGVESGISEIQAGQQAILSASNQLKATRAGYIVGTRTMVDVLYSVTLLTQTQLAYANDRYNYLEGIFNLKLQAGTLSVDDIQTINRWLGPSVAIAKHLMPLAQLNHSKMHTSKGQRTVNGPNKKAAVGVMKKTRHGKVEHFTKKSVKKHKKAALPVPAAPGAGASVQGVQYSLSQRHSVSSMLPPP